MAELILAILFMRGSRRAASWLAGYQAICLWGAGFALSVHLGADNHLAPLVTNLAIPTVLLVMLLRGRDRRLQPVEEHPVEHSAYATGHAAKRISVEV
jgi:hypothetical protein